MRQYHILSYIYTVILWNLYAPKEHSMYKIITTNLISRNTKRIKYVNHDLKYFMRVVNLQKDSWPGSKIWLPFGNHDLKYFMRVVNLQKGIYMYDIL